MGLLSTANVWAQFKLGIYDIRQITRIEKRGVVVSSANYRYQPDGGIRHELTPDEWFLFVWQFFPRNYSNDEEFVDQECYYDYFSPTGRHRSSLYKIFKNGHDTGYILDGGGNNRGDHFYNGSHINQFGISKYESIVEHLNTNPLSNTHPVVYAAVKVLADRNGFKKTKIDLSRLRRDCELNSESCALYLKLTKMLKDCRHTQLQE
ncbi:hypothetical protein [Nitrosomonas communis]|uniref:hypothetical protein n=1 Tax=Nitrosomonas communis TaxID=44574 RepID=UPI0026E9AEE6|nr:hypothetical protein [Nitrosomonas communis]MCO6426856.1 hypothetical protein [Nitrosomonas communis]